jgi:hypothetical protein
MSSININKINRQLENGIIPDCLNYTKQESEPIDMLKLRYNTFYKTHEYFEKRFHPCLKNIPGFHKIIDEIVESNKDNSLTKEMEERRNILSDDNIEDGK